MILKDIKYSQYINRPEAWELEKFSLEQINLIVGKNATGKSRTLNIIAGLANLVSGDAKLIYRSGDYEVVFQNKKKVIKYILSYEDARVTKEELIIDKKHYLKRGKGGKGKILAIKLDREMEFQTPENELACVARRDSIQHPFFEDLYKWGKFLRHYYFGTQLGKDVFSVSAKGEEKEQNLKETNNVIYFFKKGLQKHGKAFTEQIKKEMKFIGYTIDEIGVGPVPGLILPQGMPVTEIEGIYVKETDLLNNTYQTDISQGMFRALSLLIQLNFSQRESVPSCILIDDIGEGLDYERSTALIKILIEKAEKSHIELIMSTNDRFVMNNVPLAYWCVIKREGGKCKIFNYRNSKKIFDDFAFTGLANFDFLSSDFYLKGFSKK